VKRRAFLGGSLLALVVPRAVRAQTQAPRIGILLPRPGASSEAFRKGLRELGYVDGQNLAIESRVAGKPIDQPAMASELVNSKVDVIVTWTTPAALAAAAATSAIPIAAMSGDPVRIGLAASLARPGGNVTGVALMTDELEIKKLELLKETVPRASRIAILWNRDNPVWGRVVDRLREVAATLAVKLHELPVSDASQFDGALRSARIARAGALLVVEENLFTVNKKGLAKLVAMHRVPAIFHQEDFVELGGLMSCSVNTSDMLYRLAGYVDRIIRGAKPADLPIEQPRKFDIAVNLKTAKAFALAVPQSILLRANRIFE
jgi:putative ABC transport system substrate-binding protein